VIEKVLKNVDVKAGIGLDGKFHVGLTGKGPLKDVGVDFTGDLKTGDFNYQGYASIDAGPIRASGKISGDDDGNFNYNVDTYVDAGPISASGRISGDDKGKFTYGGTASGKLGPLYLDGGFEGDSEGNFNAWLNAQLHMADLFKQASQDGTPLVEVCE